MPWRITVPAYGPIYQIVCPDCGLRCGWGDVRFAERHIIELADDGRDVRHWRTQEYKSGADGTCPGHQFGRVARAYVLLRRQRRAARRRDSAEPGG